MSSLRENLDPANWDGPTYFKCIKEMLALQMSSQSQPSNIALAGFNSVRLPALIAAIETYESAAFLRQTQPTDFERD